MYLWSCSSLSTRKARPYIAENYIAPTKRWRRCDPSIAPRGEQRQAKLNPHHTRCEHHKVQITRRPGTRLALQAIHREVAVARRGEEETESNLADVQRPKAPLIRDIITAPASCPHTTCRRRSAQVRATCDSERRCTFPPCH